MIKLDKVQSLLKSEGKMSFDDIYDKTNDQLNLDELDTDGQKKAILYNSMIVDSALIMIGDNVWDLSKNYSYEEIERIKNINLGMDK